MKFRDIVMSITHVNHAFIDAASNMMLLINIILYYIIVINDQDSGNERFSGGKFAAEIKNLQNFHCTISNYSIQ